MKIFEFILNKTFLEQELEDNAYYFRIDFLKVMNIKEAKEASDFVVEIQNTINSTSSDFNTILNKLTENEIEFVYDGKSQIWQNNNKDVVISMKGIIREAKDFNELQNKIETIKLELIKEGIYIKISNYAV